MMNFEKTKQKMAQAITVGAVKKDGVYILNAKNENAISLIALIITIIVIIILAAVVIGSALNTPEQATEARLKSDVVTFKEKLELYIANENLKLAINAQTFDGSKLNAKSTTYTYKGVVQEGKNIYTILPELAGTKYDGKIEVVSGDLVYKVTSNEEAARMANAGVRVRGYEQTIDGTVISPVLGKGMIPITYNGSKWVVADITSAWFNYNTDTKQWANVMMSDGTYKADTVSVGQVIEESELGSMFVYVPRYEYKITPPAVGSAVTANGSIVAKFIPTTQLTVDEGYDYIHSAFTTDINNGGWDKELAGIWVAKFEASRSDAEAGVQGVATTLKVVPNVQSWGSGTIGAFYTTAFEFNRDLDSHLMKNSEWGAVAYLTYTTYGQGSAVRINNHNDNGSSWSSSVANMLATLTGRAATSADAGVSATTAVYTDTTNGVKASTTGNVYGIYDMSGGKFEYVASFNNIDTVNTTRLANGNTFASIGGGSSKYATAYTSGTGNTTEGGKTKYPGPTSTISKIGDATYEVYITHAAAGNYLYPRSWNSDYSDFVEPASPFFRRGGYYLDGAGAGVFYAVRGTGDALGYYGFRPVVAF